MFKQYVCKCDTSFESGGYCSNCDSLRIEVINEARISEILEQCHVNTISEIDLLTNFIYIPQYCNYLEWVKRLVPIKFSKIIDDKIFYCQRQRDLIDLDQDFSVCLQDGIVKTKLVNLYSDLSKKLIDLKKFNLDIVYLERIKISSQIHAIENVFNQALYKEANEILIDNERRESK